MQSHFTGSSMYNTGGQAAFGSPGFGGAMVQGTQNFGGHAGGQQGFYPNWFAQYTGRQPMQIDQLIQMQFQQQIQLLLMEYYEELNDEHTRYYEEKYLPKLR